MATSLDNPEATPKGPDCLDQAPSSLYGLASKAWAHKLNALFYHNAMAVLTPPGRQVAPWEPSDDAGARVHKQLWLWLRWIKGDLERHPASLALSDLKHAVYVQLEAAKRAAHVGVGLQHLALVKVCMASFKMCSDESGIKAGVRPNRY